MRALGLRAQTGKSAKINEFMKESTAKKIVLAMGYFPVDFDF